MPQAALTDPAKQAARFDADDATDPIELFQRWLEEASATEPNDPDAAALATATPQGVPSVRMVLMKRADREGFRFYTNAESQKGRELSENPRAAMCFHWKSQRRQVRVEGTVEDLSAAETDTYFHSRSHMSQVGAAVSAQSRPLESREALVEAANRFETSCAGEVPRPTYWRGYLLRPERIEFWQSAEFRLHDRMLFSHTDAGWTKTRLYP